jgi:hypothetical protein
MAVEAGLADQHLDAAAEAFARRARPRAHRFQASVAIVTRGRARPTPVGRGTRRRRSRSASRPFAGGDAGLRARRSRLHDVGGLAAAARSSASALRRRRRRVARAPGFQRGDLVGLDRRAIDRHDAHRRRPSGEGSGLGDSG